MDGYHSLVSRSVTGWHTLKLQFPWVGGLPTVEQRGKETGSLPLYKRHKLDCLDPAALCSFKGEETENKFIWVWIKADLLFDPSAHLQSWKISCSATALPMLGMESAGWAGHNVRHRCWVPGLKTVIVRGVWCMDPKHYPRPSSNLSLLTLLPAPKTLKHFPLDPILENERPRGHQLHRAREAHGLPHGLPGRDVRPHAAMLDLQVRLSLAQLFGG